MARFKFAFHWRLNNDGDGEVSYDRPVGAWVQGPGPDFSFAYVDDSLPEAEEAHNIQNRIPSGTPIPDDFLEHWSDRIAGSVAHDLGPVVEMDYDGTGAELAAFLVTTIKEQWSAGARRWRQTPKGL
jgi:hypothetical protein